MSDQLDPAPLPAGLGISAEDWQQTPLRVRLVMLTLLKRLEALESRLQQNSSNSSRPPLTDSPTKKHNRRTKAPERHRPGAKPGPRDPQQVLGEPTAAVAVFPEACACGYPAFADLIPYHTHQVIALPIIRPAVIHWRRHQSQCLSCGRVCKAPVPVDHTSGYGPRLTGFVGAMGGIVGASRSAVQDLCASVCGILLSKGAIQKMVDRVSEAIMPHDTAMGEVAHTAPVNDIDETLWLLHGDRHCLWVMANPVENVEANIARFGERVHADLQRLCHMGRERPTVGQ